MLRATILVTSALMVTAPVAFANFTSTITVADSPGVMQLSPDNQILYVAHKCRADGTCGGAIELIDTQTKTIKKTLMDRNATTLVAAKDGHTLYAATDDIVYGISDPLGTDTLNWAVDVWSDFVRPINATLSPDQKKLYVTLEKITTAREIAVFDTIQGVETAALEIPDLLTEDIQLAPDGERLYGINFDGRAVQLLVINPALINQTLKNPIIAKIKLGDHGLPSHALRVSPDGNWVYVSVFTGINTGVLYTINTNTNSVVESKNQLMDDAIIDMQLSPDGKIAYELTQHHLLQVEMATGIVQQTIPLSAAFPERLVIDTAHKTAYITEFTGNKVTVVEL